MHSCKFTRVDTAKRVSPAKWFLPAGVATGYEWTNTKLAAPVVKFHSHVSIDSCCAISISFLDGSAADRAWNC